MDKKSETNEEVVHEVLFHGQKRRKQSGICPWGKVSWTKKAKRMRKLSMGYCFMDKKSETNEEVVHGAKFHGQK